MDIVYDECTKGYTIQKVGKETLDQESISEVGYNDCIVLLEALSHRWNLKVLCGEGDYGSDGFIALLDLELNTLKWLAFFENSNPFENVEIHYDHLVGITNLHYRWRFNLKNPQQLDISR